MSNVFDHGHGGGEQGQQGDALWCYFHPKELLVGVCAHCLRERLLLLLASKQQGGDGGRARVPADGASYLSARPYCRALRRVRTGSIVSVLALGSSLIHRLDSSSRHHHQHDVVGHGGDDVKDDKDKVDPDGEDDASSSIASLDDSFISIKFEDNGKATWMDDSEKADGDAAAKSADKAAAAAPLTAAATAVVEHVKRGGGVGATRWRKQVVGRLLQLARWKRAATGGGKQAVSSAAEQQRAKGRGGRGWIRSLTRRRAAHGDRAWS